MKSLLRVMMLWPAVFAAPALARRDEPEGAGTADRPEAQRHATEPAARIGGRTNAYTVAAVTMLMKKADGKPHALAGFTVRVAKGGKKEGRSCPLHPGHAVTDGRFAASIRTRARLTG